MSSNSYDLTFEIVTLIRLGNDSYTTMLPDLGFTPMVVRQIAALQIPFDMGLNCIHKLQTVFVPLNLCQTVCGDLYRFRGQTLDLIVMGWTESGQLKIQVRGQYP